MFFRKDITLQSSFSIYIILSLLFTACSNNKEAKKDNTKTTQPEVFTSFFKSFNTSPQFQKQRIEFPLNYISWEIDEEDPSSSKIASSEWEFLNFYNDSLNLTTETDRFSTRTEIKNDTTYYLREGIDNGIRI